MVVSDASGGEALHPPPQPPSSFFIFLKVASSHGTKTTSTSTSTSTSTIHNIHNNHEQQQQQQQQQLQQQQQQVQNKDHHHGRQQCVWGGGAAPSRTSNSGPSIVCFVHCDEGICPWPKLCAIFHVVFGQRSGSNNFFWIRSVRQFLLPFHTKAFLSTWIIFFDAHNNFFDPLGIIFFDPLINFFWSPTLSSAFTAPEDVNF